MRLRLLFISAALVDYTLQN